MLSADHAVRLAVSVSGKVTPRYRQFVVGPANNVTETKVAVPKKPVNCRKNRPFEGRTDRWLTKQIVGLPIG